MTLGKATDMTTEDAPPREMTKRQRDAVRSLERAFLTASKAGLAVCAMDDNLTAYRADDLDERAADSDLYEAQRSLSNEGFDVQIRTSGVFRESGGW